MRKPTKTRLEVRWPDDSRSHVVRRGKMWHLYLPNGQDHGSSDLQGVEDNAKAYGGVLLRLPNPAYDRERREWENAQLRRMFRPYFSF